MRSTMTMALSRSVHVKHMEPHCRAALGATAVTTGARYRTAYTSQSGDSGALRRAGFRTTGVPIKHKRGHQHQYPARGIRAQPDRRLGSTLRAAASSEDGEATYIEYIKDVAMSFPPKLLPELLGVLQAQGQQLVPPSARKGLHPLLIPLSSNPDTDEVTGLLRWPTPPDSAQELPVVRTASDGGLVMLAQSAKEYVHRAIVEEDREGGAGPVQAAAGAAGELLYAAGDSATAQRLEVYLTQKVGKFPDMAEKLTQMHLDKADEMSCLITAEWYLRVVPGWARSTAHHAKLLEISKRPDEARDTARVALCSPWWTLAPYTYSEMAVLAGFEGKPAEWVHEMLHAEMAIREAQQAGAADAPGGQVERTPEEVAAGEAVALMDLMMTEKSCAWGRIQEELAAKYKAAGMNKVARYVEAGEL